MQTKPPIGSIRKLASGKHQARFTYRGAHHCETRDTWEEAFHWLNDSYGKILQRRCTEPTKRKFGDLAEEWFDELDVRPGTLAEYRGLLDSKILPVFGSRPILDIEIADVRAFLKAKQKERSAGTVQKYKVLMSQVFNYAIEQQYISPTDNPCRYVRVKQPQGQEMRYLSLEELLKLAGAANRPNSLAIRIMGLCGLRAGELWDLKVKNVDLERQRIHVVSSVRQVKGKGLVSGLPKNGIRRSVPLPTPLLEDLRKQMAGKDPDDYVFTTASGSQIQHTNWRRDVWAPALEYAGIDPKLRVHDLRHTCAAIYFKAGRTGEEVRRILGHASIETTHKHYAHLFPEAFDRMVDGIDAEIAAVLEQQEPAGQGISL